MPFTWDKAALSKAVAKVDALTKVPAKAAASIANGFRKVLDHQFEDGVDPDGRPWESLSAETLKVHGPPAFEGSAMRDDATVTVSGTTVVMTVPSPAEFHQKTRPILPEDGEELPTLYAEALQSAVNDLE